MALPDALDFRAFRDSVVVRRGDFVEPRRGTAESFSWSVIHDDHLRFDGVEMRGRSRIVERRVATCLIDADFANQICRAREFKFFRPVEVAQVEKGEPPVGKERADAPLVFRARLRLLHSRGAEWIRLAAINWIGNHVAVGGDDIDVNGAQRDSLARLDDGSLVAADVKVSVEPALITFLGIGAVVDTLVDSPVGATANVAAPPSTSIQ